MPNLQELRNKARDLKIWGRSKMEREQLEKAIAAVAGEKWYKEDMILKKEKERDKWYQENVKCDQCLHEQYIQKKIDKARYNQQLLNNTIRQLVCDYCEHTELVIDGDKTVCNCCGAVQVSDVDQSHYYWHK